MVSVCMPTYNGAQYLEAQVSSILIQLDNTDELIISDDGSIDDTLNVLLAFNDSRIKLFHANTKSPIYNLENALKQAEGDIIILSDQDDVWLNGRVEEIKKALADSDMVVTNGYIVNQKLVRDGATIFGKLQTNKRVINNLLRNTMVGCCMAFKKEVLQDVLPFPKKLPMHDQWIGMIGLLRYRVKLLDRPSILYRRHSSNASATGAKSKNSFSTKIRFRINIMMALLAFGLSLRKKNI
ncbi:glycosyltransferase [Pedobacter sp. SYP-B3415]|uniref:glycosyltransferase n=1 Tax=Pedobacter sp. SYP-B3415 TaxID=2496641 RepID=UPI00101DB92D|nr:glycosyltransferase [Pedobacter sp. SYP-B3415]